MNLMEAYGYMRNKVMEWPCSKARIPPSRYIWEAISSEGALPGVYQPDSLDS